MEDAINYLLGKLKRIVLESSQAMYLAKEATAEPGGIVSRDSPLHSLQAGAGALLVHGGVLYTKVA